MRRVVFCVVFFLVFQTTVSCTSPESISTAEHGGATAEFSTLPANSAEAERPTAMLATTPELQLTRQAPTQTPEANSTETVVPTNSTRDAECFRAEFIRDLTYSDGTGVAPGEIFLKIWRFRNDGSCTWNQSLLLDFVGGERFSGPDDVGIRYFEQGSELELGLGDRDWTDLQIYEVPPGGVADLAFVLRAPLEEGRYRGHWQVLSEDAEVAVMQFYIDVEVTSSMGDERGIWAGEWQHENQWSDPGGNPLVFQQQDRQIDGYYYSSDGEIFLIEASLSLDGMSMEGSFGQAWRSGVPFVLQMSSGQNVFSGHYSDSSFTGGAWCGSRSGHAVPLGECLLVD